MLGKTTMANNCIHCSIDPILRFGAALGTPHVLCVSNSNPNNSGIYYSNVSKYCPIILQTFLIVSAVFYFLAIKEALAKSGDVFENITLLANFMYIIRASLCVLQVYLKTRVGAVMFATIQDSMNGYKFERNRNLLTKYYSARIRLRCAILVCSSICFMILYTLFLIYHRDNAKISIWMKIATLVCFYSDAIVLTFNKSICDIFTGVLATHHNALKRELKIGKDTSLFVNCNAMNANVKDTISSFSKLHSSFICGVKYWNVYLDPGALLWILVAVVMLIANVYVTINYISVDKSKLLTPEYVELGIQIYVSELLMMVYMTDVERLGKVGENLLSFLLKYPLSKLSPTDAVQVEMLISTLTLQKAELRASGIFSVGTRLLASISGTVVTYVLVALQFHASWTKQ